MPTYYYKKFYSWLDELQIEQHGVILRKNRPSSHISILRSCAILPWSYECCAMVIPVLALYCPFCINNSFLASEAAWWLSRTHSVSVRTSTEAFTVLTGNKAVSLWMNPTLYWVAPTMCAYAICLQCMLTLSAYHVCLQCVLNRCGTSCNTWCYNCLKLLGIKLVYRSWQRYKLKYAGSTSNK